MPDFLKKWLENLSKIWKGITTTQKIIGGIILGAAVIAIVVILTVSTSGDGVPLFTNQITGLIAGGTAAADAAVRSIHTLAIAELLCIGAGIAAVLFLPKIHSKGEVR